MCGVELLGMPAVGGENFRICLRKRAFSRILTLHTQVLKSLRRVIRWKKYIFGNLRAGSYSLDIIVRGILIFRNKVGRIQFYGVRLVCVSAW